MIRNSSININEEEHMEKELVDKWNSIFAVNANGVSDDEQLKIWQKVFIQLFLLAESLPSIYLKKLYSEYLIRGSDKDNRLS